MSAPRMPAAERKAAILDAALALSAERGYARVTRNEIARHAQVSGPTVQHYFRSVAALRVEIMIHAVRQRNAQVVAQGLADSNPYAKRADDALRREAAIILMRA